MDRPFLSYLQAIAWFVLSLVVSCGNDAIMKHVGTQISPWQVAFFRCFFGTVTLLPLMWHQGQVSFTTHRPLLHIVRGGLLFAAMSLWGHGVKEVPITTATIMSFTVPIFVLLLAPVFLRERVTWPVWVATLIGFGGIVLVLQPSSWSLFGASMLFVLAAGVFGLLDIINKKYVAQESMLCMLFYSTLVATILLAFPALCAGKIPAIHIVWWLLVLGIGSNLILYLLLKAFALASVSSLAPFRYLELLISMGVGYLFFQELPNKNSCLGAAVIIPCALFTVYYQSRSAHRPPDRKRIGANIFLSRESHRS
jgi:S-adenosylmethionine uptake transporter